MGTDSTDGMVVENGYRKGDRALAHLPRNLPALHGHLSLAGYSWLSQYLWHAYAMDHDSESPLPHTREATSLLCSSAHDAIRFWS